jgi:hypothetical protein
MPKQPNPQWGQHCAPVTSTNALGSTCFYPGSVCLPWKAGAQVWAAICTGWCCIGEGELCTASTTIGRIIGEVDLTAIAWIPITVVKPAKGRKAGVQCIHWLSCPLFAVHTIRYVVVTPTSATGNKSIASLPCVAGAQGRLAVHASWCCIAEGGCCYFACPTVGSICVQVCFTAIACIPITVAKPAKNAKGHVQC